MKDNKTNVMRLLEAKGVGYLVRSYEPDARKSGKDIALALGIDPDSCFKTLVTYSEKEKEHLVFVIPVSSELDLKKAAKASGVKDVSMIREKDLLPLTGYVHGGCSPIGMKKTFRTFVDETAILYDRIAFSAGKVGFQVEISFSDLEKVVDYVLADLAKS